MIHIIFLAILMFSQASYTNDNIPALEKKIYNFSNDPIDVVIPAIEKDLRTLELCIKGIKQQVKKVRRIIVVSATKLTDQAEWFAEERYPFSKYDMVFQIFKNEYSAKKYLDSPKNRSGWIYQQLLKLYAPFVIPNVSSNVLIVDSDTIFLNPVEFTDSNGAGLYNPAWEYHPAYFKHGARLIPGFKRVFQKLSGISHHMLFQREILLDLFNTVEDYHKTEFWRAFCNCIDHKEMWYSCASEYEIYFNFLFAHTDQCTIRSLRWKNLKFTFDLNPLQEQHYHYVSCHTYLKKIF